MPFLKNWPQNANLFDVFRADVEIYRPLAEFSEQLLRGPSSLTPGERELIAAYVSGLNACRFCLGAHTAMAAAFGVEAGLLDQLINDIDTAAVDEKFKPLLRLARRITLEPTRLMQADADAVFAAGWDDKAYRDTVAVAGFLNMMNRLAEGFGIGEIPREIQARVGEAFRRDGYLKRFMIEMQPPRHKP
jgi:uncharacterized peroxidase-related enzyme